MNFPLTYQSLLVHYSTLLRLIFS